MARAAPWQKGKSGNPKGRPPGKSPITKMRESLMGDIPDILKALVEGAKAGDPACAKLILERVLPSLKPSEMPVALALNGETLTDKGKMVLDAIADGQIAPAQGAQLVAAIGQLARVSEIDELQRRVEALEGRNNG